jgi:tight adherence protein C
MYELMVGGLAFLAVVATGGSVIVVMAARRWMIQNRLRGAGGPLNGQPEVEVRRGPLERAVGWLGQVALGSGHSANLRETLARAGYHAKSAAAVYMGAKILLLLVGCGVPAALVLRSTIEVQYQFFLIVTGGGVLFFLPNLVLAWRRKIRRQEVRMHLPDVMDLLEICVSSGMGLDMAWNLASEEVRAPCPILADEMALTNLEMHLGSSRVAAMRHMADRTEAEEISSFASLLAQADQFGTSISDTLRTFAGTMRDERSTRAQEEAEKTAVKLLFPMIVFVFPPVLVVMAGPAVLTLIEKLGT